MKFMLLLYGDEAAERALPEDAARAIIEAHGAFTDELRAAGADVYGAALSGSSNATTVRRDGDEVLTDGPFAEAREQIGGIYAIEAADIDEALAWARKVPLSPGLSVEVRPLLEV